MPKYAFSAKHLETGGLRTGKLVAKDEKALFLQLRSEGFLLTSHREVKESSAFRGFSFLESVLSSVSLKEKMMFARNLSIMVSSGVQISLAVEMLAQQTKNKRFRKALEDISEKVQSGVSLGDALGQHPSVFNNLFVSMVRVGEMGGNLEGVLQIVAVQMEKEHDLISKVRGAMMYPSVVVLAMIGVGVVMLTYILPKLTSVFTDMNVQLPATTQAIIALSDFLREHVLVLSFFLLFGTLSLVFFAKTINGKKFFSFIVLHFPIIKEIVIKTNSARFARIYSSLLKSGVPVVEVLTIISETLSNYFYQKAAKKSKESVQKGVSLSDSLRDMTIFPPLMFQIVQVGEATGKTDEVLLKLAEFYEADVDQMTKNMSSIIEPFLMIFLGIGVGFFAVAMLTPMYSMMGSI